MIYCKHKKTLNIIDLYIECLEGKINMKKSISIDSESEAINSKNQWGGPIKGF